MKNLLYTLLFVIFGCVVYGQQLTHTTPLQQLNHIWNPAFTAPNTNLDASIYYRRQWLGFKDAPQTAIASVMYPFVDMNMSAGGQIIVDQTGPISKTGVQLNYAYKLRELLNDDDQLSFGINGYFHQFTFNQTDLNIREAVDVILTTGRQSKFVPAFGTGFAYISNIEEFNGDNAFYVGFSAMQLLQQDVFLATGNAQRQRHFFLVSLTLVSMISPSMAVS